MRQAGGQSASFRELWHIQMSHHDAIYACIDGLLERIKLNAVHAGTCEIQRRERLVRVHIRIAMPREMFSYCYHTASLQALHIGYDLARHVGRVFPEGARIDHWVIRVVVHIGHRGEVHCDAKFAHLAGTLQSVGINQRIFLNTPQHTVAWIRHSIRHAHAQSPLTIAGDHHRDVCELLC